MKLKNSLAVGTAAHTGSRLPASRQRGVALVIALILLIVITLVGLAAVGGTIMQQKMASNIHDREVAFQSSEAALRAGSYLVRANSDSGFIRDCSRASGNVCLNNPFGNPDVPAGAIQTVASGSGAAKFSPVSIATGQPQFIVQYMGEFTSRSASGLNQTANSMQYGGSGYLERHKYFRITARSGDPDDVNARALVTLQATIKL